ERQFNEAVFRDGGISSRPCPRGARLRVMAEAALALRFRGGTLGSGILQALCRVFQDFARKLLVRYGTSHTDRTDQRAIGQDCLRSCTALVRLVPITNQSCQQLNVVANFPADECASALVAACEVSCQSADWATHTWMIEMGFAQIFIDQRFVGDRRTTRGGGIHLTPPEFERDA